MPINLSLAFYLFFMTMLFSAVRCMLGLDEMTLSQPLECLLVTRIINYCKTVFSRLCICPAIRTDKQRKK